MWKQLQQAIAERKKQGLLRHLQHPKTGIDFCSNDYLGFARAPIALKLLPSGHGGSRLISGNSTAIDSLEKRLAQHYEAEQVLIFNSGYEANSGLFGMLAALGVRVIYDQHIHASVRHALRGAKTPAWSYRHNDLNDLEAKLKKAEGDAVAVVTESLFSMDGDLGALEAIATLKKEFDFTFIVDEAHGTGVLGGFTGLTGALQLQGVVDIRIHTFGKALGGQGACIAGNALLKTALTQFCQPLIYSTAPAPVMIELIDLCHQRFAEQASGRQAELSRNIAFYLKCVDGDAAFSRNDGPIQWFACQGNERVLACAERLQISGFDVVAIRTPTVPRGSERLRICLHAFNAEKEIDQLVRELHRIH